MRFTSGAAAVSGSQRAILSLAMRNEANTSPTLARAVSAVALVLVLGFAPIACSAMVSAPAADTHPCCPKPGHADSSPCAKTGCISNVLALRATPADTGTGVLAAVGTVAAPPASSFVPERASEPAFLAITPDLFLRNRSFLI